MAKIKGDRLRFYNNNTVLSLEIESAITGNIDTIDRTNKDSLKWKEHFGGDKTWECFGRANIDFNATENITQMFSDFSLNNFVAVDLGYDTTFFSGVGLINKWSFTAPRNGLSSFRFNIRGAGALLKTTGVTSTFPFTFPFIFS